jgi:TolB-like protein
MPMKLKVWMVRAFSFVLLLILATSGFAADNRMAVNIKTLAGNIVQQFSGVELRVAAVRDDKVYLNAGKNKFISEGAIYQIIVDDLPFNDPVSRRRLGNIEIVIADVQIVTVRDNYSIAQVLDHSLGERDLAVGQRAVPQRSRISLAIIPFEYLNSLDETTPRIAQEIMAAELINSGLFVVAGSSKTKEAADLLQPDSPGTVQFSKSIGRMLGVEYVLYGFLIDSPGYMEIQCRVHSVAQGTGVVASTIRIESDFSDPQQ